MNAVVDIPLSGVAMERPEAVSRRDLDSRAECTYLPVVSLWDGCESALRQFLGGIWIHGPSVHTFLRCRSGTGVRAP